MPEPPISQSEGVHCPRCLGCHEHGDGECDGEWSTDTPGERYSCRECWGYTEPGIHVLCAGCKREARGERRAHEAGVD